MRPQCNLHPSRRGEDAAPQDEGTCRFAEKRLLNFLFVRAVEFPIQFSNSRIDLPIQLRDLAARCARVVHESFARQRAWGMPGARCTRSLVCSVVVEHTSVVTTVAPEHPAFPHAMVLTAYSVLSPATNSSCHRRWRINGIPAPGRADMPPPT